MNPVRGFTAPQKAHRRWTPQCQAWPGTHSWGVTAARAPAGTATAQAAVCSTALTAAAPAHGDGTAASGAAARHAAGPADASAASTCTARVFCDNLWFNDQTVYWNFCIHPLIQSNQL